MAQPDINLVPSHGQMVLPGKVGTSNFVRGFSTRVGGEGYFSGTWEELETLVEEHFHDHEPGTGSVDGDVLLVNVPPAGFFSAIVEITPENAHLVEEQTHVRAEGEKPVTRRIIRAAAKVPARFVQIVIYRADVLAQDDDRSTDAEWEIVSVNAALDRHTPMTPATMERNANHDSGGTLRTYTEEEWAEARAYWATHAKILVEE